MGGDVWRLLGNDPQGLAARGPLHVDTVADLIGRGRLPSRETTTLITQKRGVHTMVCTQWCAHSGLHTVACTRWCAHNGVHTMVCTQWGLGA